MGHYQQKISTILVIALSILTITESFAIQKTLGTSIPYSLNASAKVVVAKNASKTTKSVANELSAILAKMTGEKIEVTEGTGHDGIAVGTIDEFPDLISKELFDKNDSFRWDEYLLRSHKNGVYIISCTEKALYSAAYDFLYRLGYRQYFPGKAWEIIPKKKNCNIAINVLESPDFIARRIWTQWGAGPWRIKDYNDWCRKNRVPSAFKLKNQHVWQCLYDAKKKEGVWEKHPEYLGLQKGKRTSRKFCVSNPALRELFANWRVEGAKKNPDWSSYSVEPPDGAGWCECENCKKLGSISNRVAIMANAVARKMKIAFPKKKKYLGMLAYNQHADPPSIPLEPSLIVNVATRMRGSKLQLNLEETIDGWRGMGAKNMGVYEYYSVHQWHRDKPGLGDGCNTSYIAKSLKQYQRQGLRFFTAESGENFGPKGIAYYFASRALWDIKEADRFNDILAEFTKNCFGPAADTMIKFYNLIDGKNRSSRNWDVVGHMYRILKKALNEAKTPEQQERIKQLIKYTVYADYFTRYNSEDADLKKRQLYFEAMMKHVYRIRKTGMVHTWAFGTLAHRDKKIKWPKKAQLRSKNNPWLSDKPFSGTEIEHLLKDGIQRNKISNLKWKTFSNNLVPTDKLNIPKVTPGACMLYNRMFIRKYFFYVNPDEKNIRINIGGENLIARLYANVKGSRQMISRHTINNPIAKDTVAKDKKYEITLKTPHSGLYWLEVKCGVNSIYFPDKRPFVIDAGLGFGWGEGNVYFYVPKGTKVLAGTVGVGFGRIRSPDGKTHYEVTRRQYTDYVLAKVKPKWSKQGDKKVFNIPVLPGQDGKLWKLENAGGPWLPTTVPPYFVLSREELLLPREVVESELKSTKKKQ